MLTFNKLGHKGNLGNQLFQVASTIGLAKQYNQQFTFPNWEYAKYFNFDFNINDKLDIKDWKLLKEENFNYYDWNILNENCIIDGWLQTDIYFKNINLNEIFKFNSNFENDLIKKNKNIFSKSTILITIRRGDFVDNKNYFQISYKYYFTALLKYFPNYKDYNIIFTSDDINYCKYHFSFLENALFLDNLSAIEQLCLASKCNHFIISNSTFSWWIAKLGEKNNVKIICPIRNFRGEYALKYNEKDFFPKSWIKHDDSKVRIPFTFIKLIVKGNIFKIKHRVINFFKKNFNSFKKKIKKIIGKI